ncbi:hypothetical protein AWC15_15845 [Mycobacterium lacus]|nr:hypothetical protein AWC15_15845 [Mycobacterium lacus]
MYSGPGMGPMLAAAAAWDGLAAELGSAASGYASVISELSSSPWLGPASMAMVASATPYFTWLDSAAELAEQAGMQARAAAAAYEAAFAMTVPPPVIAANRVLLMTLIATNFFGQNTPAIAATEAQYAEMWAQDAAAMYGYAGASATASELTPFTEPAQATDATGLAAQAAAVSKAAATPGAASAQTVAAAAPELTIGSAVPGLLQQLSTAASAAMLDLNNSQIAQLLGTITPAMRTSLVRTMGLSYFAVGIPQFFASIGQQLTFGPGGTTAGSGGAWYPTPQFAGLGLGGGGPASASLASAVKVGPLSVPPTWIATETALEQRVARLVGANVAAAGSPNAANGVLNGLPMRGAGRRAAAGFTHKYGFRQSVLTRPPSAG